MMGTMMVDAAAAVGFPVTFQMAILIYIPEGCMTICNCHLRSLLMGKGDRLHAPSVW